ncbi:MAG TPA: hypothetical protein VG722_09110 [Tepidisphaeraceae bacterium]|nr:hypothetical protein [Tepidisphaeraceae bacterium]
MPEATELILNQRKGKQPPTWPGIPLHSAHINAAICLVRCWPGYLLLSLLVGW